jgi:heptosyltransferase-1
MRILIVRVSALGDTIHTLPALDILKKNLPEAKIDWLVQHKAAEIVSHVPGLNQIYKLSDRYLLPRYWRQTISTMGKLRAARYDLIIDFQGLLKTSILILALDAPSIGLGWHSAREPLSALVHTKNINIPSRTNIIEKNNMLARAAVTMLTDMPVEKNTSGRIFSAPQASTGAQEQIASWVVTNGAKRLILLSPNTTWASKHWPLPRWEELVFKLGAEQNHTIVLIGQNFGKQGARLASFIQQHSLSIAIAPAWTLDAIFAVMQHTDLIIAPDTGLLHIADCLGVNTIGFYGPTKAMQHGPQISTGNRELCFQINCIHDYQKTHGKITNSSQNQDCMYKLSADDVLKRVNSVIGQTGGDDETNLTFAN